MDNPGRIVQQLVARLATQDNADGACASGACTIRLLSRGLWDKSALEQSILPENQLVIAPRAEEGAWLDRQVVGGAFLEAPPPLVISLRGGHVPVPKQLLDLDDVHPGVEQQPGRRCAGSPPQGKSDHLVPVAFPSLLNSTVTDFPPVSAQGERETCGFQGGR